MDVALTTASKATRLPARDGGALYERALAYLYARTNGPYKFGLERTHALLAALGDPHRLFPSLHVAGTNGKGSSVATMQALLSAKNLRVGTYTSPHLVDFRERIAINGRFIDADEVTEFVERWTPMVESLGATFFEATTALAFAHFAKEEVDVAVIETGLGGRLDSTNVIDPVAAGVTSIDFDHTEYLGDTLEKIAAEKAGIFKNGRPAVVGETDPALSRTLASRARAAAAAPVRIVVEECTITDIAIGRAGTSFVLDGLGARRALTTPLVGRHQAENTAFALVMLDAAGAPYATTLDEAAESLADVRVLGRFQREGSLIFDVAHNPEGSAVLADTLRAVQPQAPVVALLSVLADKDWRSMMRTLASVVSHFVLTIAPTAPTSRQWNLDEVVGFAVDEGIDVEAISDFDAAIARSVSAGKTTLITGSFHTVGDAMARLQVSPLSR